MPFGQGDRWLEVSPPGAATTIALVQAQSSDQPVEISFLTKDVAGTTPACGRRASTATRRC